MCESEYYMSNIDPNAKEVLKINMEPIFVITRLVYTFFKYVGLLLLGVVVGAGVVIKNPPQDTQLVKKMRELEVENNTLKIQLSKPEFITKESIVIK